MTDQKSNWVHFRDKATAFFEHLFTAAAPIAEHVAIETGKAVVTAMQNGVDLNSHEMAKVALNSIHSQMPGIQASVSLALAGTVLHDVAQGQAAAPPVPAQ